MIPRYLKKLAVLHEVDALLSGISDGDIETESDEAPDSSDIGTYDLTSQGRVIRGKMPTLDVINQRFSREFRIALSNILRKTVDVTFISTETIKLEDFKNLSIYCKLEYYNPTGSVKDRAASYIINNLFQTQKIDNDTTIIESSSGNFGIALSAYCRKSKLKFICIIDPHITPANELIIKSFILAICASSLFFVLTISDIIFIFLFLYSFIISLKNNRVISVLAS